MIGKNLFKLNGMKIVEDLSPATLDEGGAQVIIPEAVGAMPAVENFGCYHQE